ncbi:uncharacterized protein PHALS_13878 [Plasmopara halstedii]|uniref:Uncharacterized protein n=1 Tax=Plasmopara halstedii TaxID=4781 RepID=A0A0P1A3S8_PLAHL|nr:uncharacterized protein PHALS_13878 [Plasmopara halstedii]CEG35118.1 hypothetical protein PHALS_13878 [Plasmopara halstedii]|eukprot:XP_024571487.1 hypothetical protein PHALS_13878 [Plasmopara halstedii]
MQQCHKRKNRQQGNYNQDIQNHSNRGNIYYFENEFVHEETIATTSNEAITTLTQAETANYSEGDLIFKKRGPDDHAVLGGGFRYHVPCGQARIFTKYPF